MSKESTHISSPPFCSVIDAKEYLKYFYSDRMHMFKDGKWSSPPPHYKPIMNGVQFRNHMASGVVDTEKCSNLEDYISMPATASNGIEYIDAHCATVTDSHEVNLIRPLSLPEFRFKFAQRQHSK